MHPPPACGRSIPFDAPPPAEDESFNEWRARCRMMDDRDIPAIYISSGYSPQEMTR